MARKVESAITIHAPARRVWEVLTDFDRFPQWNPFILKARGKVREGEKVRILMKLRSGFRMPVRPTLLKVEPERELVWIGRLLIPGLIDGEHHFLIEPVSDSQVRFIQREVFHGVLLPFFWWMLKGDALSGFASMNQALKCLLEKGR